MREYTHMESDEGRCFIQLINPINTPPPFTWDTNTIMENHVSRVPYAGREVLVKYVPIVNKPYVAVLGFICGDYMRPRENDGLPFNGVPFTNVEPIVDENHRRDITDILRKDGGTDPIHFW